MINSENVKSFYEHVSDRIKDPFMGTYSFFIMLCNWKIFLVSFSDETFYYKLFVIQGLISEENYRSIWLPLVFASCFFILSSLLKIVFRFVAQAFQRLDDLVVRVPMDKEKIGLLQENSLMRVEIDNLIKKNEELIRLHTYIKGFYIEVNPLTNDIQTRGNELANSSASLGLNSNLQSSFSTYFANSVELANKIENFKTNVSNIYRIK